MLKLEINVVPLGKNLEFSLDEDTKISTLIEEVCSIVSARFDKKWEKPHSEIYLCDKNIETFLPKDMTLRECGVHSGHELLLL